MPRSRGGCAAPVQAARSSAWRAPGRLLPLLPALCCLAAAAGAGKPAGADAPFAGQVGERGAGAGVPGEGWGAAPAGPLWGWGAGAGSALGPGGARGPGSVQHRGQGRRAGAERRVGMAAVALGRVACKDVSEGNGTTHRSK